MKPVFFFLIVIIGLFGCVEPADPSESEGLSQNILPMDSINQLILDEPGKINHYLTRAHLFQGDKDFVSAMDDLNRALLLDSTFAETHHQLGSLHYISKNVDLALTSFDKCLEYNPDHIGCLLKRAEIDLLLRKYPEALEGINRALKIDQFQPEAYYMKGLLYKETGDTANAVSSYATAIERDPQFYDAYIQLGLLYASAGSDLALEYYNSAIELRPTSIEALYNKAMFLQSNARLKPERLRQALKVYDIIDEIDPTMPTAMYNKGYVYLEYILEYDSAAMMFTEAIERLPVDHQAYYNRGLCYESLNQLTKAIEDYDRALKLKPNYTPAAIAKGRVEDNL
jgi:tetratricopeptide (TPR) repeat protein